MVKKAEIEKEVRLQGVAVSPGVAIGPAFVLGAEFLDVKRVTLGDDQVEAEVMRFQSAIEKAKQELNLLHDETAKLLGEKDAMIFEIHKMMVEDPDLVSEAVRRIRSEKKSADEIYLDLVKRYGERLASSEDEYFRARVSDLRDIARRVIRHIQGGTVKSVAPEFPSIILATDLTPSDTIHLSQSQVLAFATELGSRTSHAAIMARALKVPSVVGLGEICRLVASGDSVILDGSAGMVILHPSRETMATYQRSQKAFVQYVHKLERIKTLPARTRDGKDIEVSANIEFFEEVKPALEDGADGIGLFRTEYLYLTRMTMPSEEEQFKEYKRIVRAVGRNPVIIRTFDLGGDKAQKLFHVPQEANPFLGMRGVRLYFANEEIFCTQVRAILRASAFGNVMILLPMISGVSEVRHCRQLIEKMKQQLAGEGVKIAAEIPVGVMIEVPSAAVTADLIARECDFFSIGTNDLIQYTLAVDRGNKHVAHLYRAFNPSVLRLVRDTIRKGNEQGVWVGMCGELASDPLVTMALIGMGLNEFSVSPVSLLVIKEIIRRVDYAECENLADRVLGYSTAAEIEEYLISVFNKKFKDLAFSGLHPHRH